MRFRRPGNHASSTNAHGAARQRSLDDAVLPLTNVVFLLLIFFMLAGRLATPSAFAVQPPQSVSQAPAGDRGIQVEISADGRLALAGEPINEDQLAANVENRLAAQPGLPVVLRADGGVASNRVVGLMRRLHQAGAQQLRLITVSAPAR